MSAALQRGAKFLGGQSNANGRIVLAREDGTYSPPLPVMILRGTVVDNGDGTVSIEDGE